MDGWTRADAEGRREEAVEGMMEFLKDNVETTSKARWH